MATGFDYNQFFEWINHAVYESRREKTYSERMIEYVMQFKNNL